MPRAVYDPAASDPFPLSRSKMQLFLDCARCFYLDRRLGIVRPSMPPFTLNNTVDLLLKREFDAYRALGEAHPLMQLYGIDAVPFAHPQLDSWRDALHGGMRVLHAPTNFLLTGAPDDVWVTGEGELHVVDYKATSTVQPLTLDLPSREGYKRQLEFYGWLLQGLGHAVSDRAFIVYANARRDRDAFNKTLSFDLQILPYEGKDAWVDDAIREAHHVLQMPSAPPATNGCAWCRYRMAQDDESVDA